MTQIVKGHGSREDDEETFVPVGTTLKFFSDFDVDLSTMVALTAIASGAMAPPKETIVGTGQVGDVANYTVWTQDDGFYATWLAMGGEQGIPIWWVGNDIPDGTRLCGNPDMCPGLGDHTCQGVLGTVRDSEIVILACRGYADDDDAGTERDYGDDPENPLHDLPNDVRARVDEILDLARRDPAAAEALVDGELQGSLAMLVNRLDFDSWQKARYLKDKALANDFPQLFGHLAANADELDDIMEWLDEIASYGNALDTVATTWRETFYQWFQQASADVQRALRSRPAIDALIDEQIREERVMAGARDMLDPEAREQEERETAEAAQRMFEQSS